MGRQCRLMRPVYLWSARGKEAVIMRMASDTLPRRATHFSDGTAFLCHPCPPPWPRCAVSGLLKTRNQLIMRAHRVEVLGCWWYSFCTTSHQLSPPHHRPAPRHAHSPLSPLSHGVVRAAEKCKSLCDQDRTLLLDNIILAMILSS
jgi:hypothetical protein